jgi:hypothetical protein
LAVRFHFRFNCEITRGAQTDFAQFQGFAELNLLRMSFGLGPCVDFAIGWLGVHHEFKGWWGLMRGLGRMFDVFDSYALALTPLELTHGLTGADYGMCVAAQLDSKKLAEAMIKQGAQLKLGLEWACYFGALQVAKLILDKFGPLNRVTADWLARNSVEFACRQGHVRLLRVVLDRGLPPHWYLMQYKLTKTVELVLVQYGVAIDSCTHPLTPTDLWKLYERGHTNFGSYTRQIWWQVTKHELHHYLLPDLTRIVVGFVLVLRGGRTHVGSCSCCRRRADM